MGWNGSVRFVTFACLGGLLWTVGTATLTDVEPTVFDGFVMVGAGALLLGVIGIVVGWTFAAGGPPRGDYPDERQRS